MRLKRIRGFYPINEYTWRDARGRARLDLLIRHSRLLPRPVRHAYAAWRMNQTPGPHWPYPWERRR